VTRTDDDPREDELSRAIDDGEVASRLVYADWLEEHAGLELPDEVRLQGKRGPTGAAPFAHDEMFRGVWLYEELSCQVANISHNPTGTGWVYASRGLWKSIPVMVFRPGDWLRTPGHVRHGEHILTDLGDRAIHSEHLRDYSWAMIEAPAGVRLRALIDVLVATGRCLADDLVFDLVRRTHRLLDTGGGDSFLGWDGSLWLSPKFTRCWNAEFPSLIGNEVHDALVLDSPEALIHLFDAPLTSEEAFEAFRVYLDGEARNRELPADASPALRSVLEPTIGRYEPAATLEMFVRCERLATTPPERCARELAALLRQHFPDAYERQHAALQSVGIDIAQPWRPRRT
jgi:uncharacterized protein (TIGR02996 family)